MTSESNPPTDPDQPQTDGGLTDVEREKQIDYMDVEINLLRPATPFMRDHLKIIWIGAIAWTITTFGPMTATYLATGAMTQTMPVLQFPFHYFMIAIFAPSMALILSIWYAWKRDQIDEKYGIEQMPSPAETEERATDTGEPTATDGGVSE